MTCVLAGFFLLVILALVAKSIFDDEPIVEYIIWGLGASAVLLVLYLGATDL